MIDTVGVVVVNYNGGPLTLECLRSVLATDWPNECLRVVLVDNASTDGVVASVKRDLPEVIVIESPVNVGFGAGCNLGIQALGDVDAIALVNNDATVEPGWLRPLSEALAADAGVGAACPKILYSGEFVEVTLEAETTRRGRGDGRELGVLLSGARVDGADVWRRTQLVQGFWGPEPGSGSALAQWSAANATLRLPVGGGEHGGAILLSAEHRRQVTVRGANRTATHEVDATPRWIDLPLDGPRLTIVNNVGTEVDTDGFGADRGRFEPDDGRFDQQTTVFAWCGAGVLLRRGYLDDVGVFDERLFLYYEDVELSWRGSKRGWIYRYVPESVVRHVHTASSVEGSSFKRYYDERNHLLVLARHADLGRGTRAAVHSLLVTLSYARRDLVAAPLRGERPSVGSVGPRLRAWASALRWTPAMLRERD